MDNQRVFIWAALAVLLWLNYTTWQRDYAPQAAPVTAATTSTTVYVAGAMNKLMIGGTDDGLGPSLSASTR